MPDRPVVTMIAGPNGSGKSTLTEESAGLGSGRIGAQWKIGGDCTLLDRQMRFSVVRDAREREADLHCDGLRHSRDGRQERPDLRGQSEAGNRRIDRFGLSAGKAMLTNRHRIALDMRAGGATFQAIGDVFGVTASRASAIYQRGLVLQTEQELGLHASSVRVLRRSPYSPEELAAMLVRDREATFLTLLRLQGCGRRQANDIISWLEAGNLELP